MRSRARVAAAVAALAVVGASASAPAASVDTIKISVQPLQNGKTEYSGRIKSATKDCVQNRRIKVTARGQILVKARSDDHGKFDKVGKTAASGTALSLKVKPKGDACPKLTGGGTAP
jgi:hypothetical protein